MCGSRGRVVNIMTSENTNSAGSSAAHIKSVESLDQSNEMERGLKNRHVQFIAIGGTIGTGLFLGSGKSIALTGPSIIFVYIGVGLIMFLLMRAIGEMMYSDPSQHTFINFITRYLGRGWGKFAGWTYWIVLILTGMTEITAVSTYFVTFFGTFGIDLNSWKWLIELCFLVALTGINLIAVKVFGEAEFWFSMIKITLIVGLIVSIFQTVTSIQEQTLTFVPKIVAVFLGMLIFGAFILTTLTDYMTELWTNFSTFLG